MLQIPKQYFTNIKLQIQVNIRNTVLLYQKQLQYDNKRIYSCKKIKNLNGHVLHFKENKFVKCTYNNYQNLYTKMLVYKRHFIFI